ncbi:MAG: FAD-dependent oxidoreductase [Actinomycetota bacterium]|nr:FAD-dependent oxidoreductase [Actinomycetota bacterium]
MGVSLWDEVRIGGLRLRNRAVMPAMGTGYGSRSGTVTERLLSYLERRAEGGAGLIITEVCAVHPSGRGFLSELGIYDDSFLPGLEALAAVVKRRGAAVAAQLHHAGRETFPAVIGEQPVAPSALPSRALGQVPRELSVAEIEELTRSFAAAARRAREAGFDAVEIHGAHGYLISQFISPYSNRREDGYGGSGEGRMRFAREVVREVRREVGPGFPVIFRLSSAELLKGGYDLDYLLPLLPSLVAEGVDALHVSCGVYDSPGNPTCPGFHHQAGINVERAAAIREHVGIPVIVVGKLHDPRIAGEVLARGKADMVAFGRQHLADPHFLAKAAEGRFEDIRFCLSCNQGCIERLMFELKPVTCTINPACGREAEERRATGRGGGPYLVVGAGPAGLQAAMTLGERGSAVRIVERESSPGGQLRAAARPPGKESLAEWLQWAIRRLRSLGIEVETGREADEGILSERDWAGVVSACGASPFIPPLPGTDLEMNAEAREVLLGRRQVRGKVLVVGAGPVGMETAHYLISRGCAVTVVEERDQPPVLPATSHGYFLHRELRERGELYLSARVKEVREGAVTVSMRGEEREMEADAVVWAVGSRPERELAEKARSAGLATMEVGDEVAPARLLEAVQTGWEAALSLAGEGGGR